MTLSPDGRSTRPQMAVRLTDIPALLVERVEAAHPAPAFFLLAEMDEWPKGVWEHLQAAGFLRSDGFADACVCPGCDWQCHKSICIRRATTGAARHAYIHCDEEPRHGLIFVSLGSLTRYRATLAGMSAFISGLMKLGPPRSSALGGSFLLGTIRGRHGPRQVSIGLHAGRIMLHVGSHQESALRFLRGIGPFLSIDMDHIRRLANRKQNAHGLRNPYLPDRSRQQERSHRTLSRNQAIFREAKKERAKRGESWGTIAVAIAPTDLARTGDDRRVSAATVLRIITEMLRRERENSRSKR